MGYSAFLFGFGGSRAAGIAVVADPSYGIEGSYHYGRGGYWRMGYAYGGYVAGKS